MPSNITWTTLRRRRETSEMGRGRVSLFSRPSVATTKNLKKKVGLRFSLTFILTKLFLNYQANKRQVTMTEGQACTRGFAITHEQLEGSVKMKFRDGNFELLLLKDRALFFLHFAHLTANMWMLLQFVDEPIDRRKICKFSFVHRRRHPFGV